MGVKMNKEDYMEMALKEAKKAYNELEIPVGAIIVKDGVIIAKAHNEKEKRQDSTKHAEILAIQRACKKLNTWRLYDCDMYVSLEPCIMCAGAIINARIKNVYIAADEPKGGAFGSSIDVLTAKNINHRPNIIKGIKKEESAKLLQDFFKAKRLK